MGTGKENIEQKRGGRVTLNSSLSKAYSFLTGSPRRISGYFIRGLFIILPLAVTLWLLVWLFNLIDGFLAPVLDLGLGRHFPGLSFAIIIFLIILIGFLGMKIGQRRFFDFIERRIIIIPGIGAIYGGTREILNAFNPNNTNSFLEVVLVEYPRKGIYAIGLVTKENKDEKGKKVLTVFIPASPSPAAGYLQIVPESEVIHTSMSVGDAIKLIVSIGRVSKEDFAARLGQSVEISDEPDIAVFK
jgi:uncharacterized membrane protein